MHVYGAHEIEGADEYIDPAEIQKSVKDMIRSGSARPPPTTRIPVVSPAVDIDIGGNGCAKCGSLSDKRSSHKSCPHSKHPSNNARKHLYKRLYFSSASFYVYFTEFYFFL